MKKQKFRLVYILKLRLQASKRLCRFGRRLWASMTGYAAHRNYCNYVKKELLKSSLSLIEPSGVEIKLLDMCCGRGGDIFKWDSLGIRRVYAFDSDSASVQEAIRRYRDYRRKTARTPITVNFHVQSALSSKYIRDTILRGTKVNIVSCMFALHYFCDLRTFLRNVSDNLNPGGIFVGVAPDSTYIKKLLDPDDPYKNDEVSVRKAPSEVRSPTDSVREAYYFLIKGDETQPTDYFTFRGESLEYLIDKDELVSLAREVSLELIEMKNIADGCATNGFAVSVDAFGRLPPTAQLYFSFIFRRFA